MAVVRPSKPASVSEVRGTRSIRAVRSPALPAASASRLPLRPAPTTARSKLSELMGRKWPSAALSASRNFAPVQLCEQQAHDNGVDGARSRPSSTKPTERYRWSSCRSEGECLADADDGATGAILGVEAAGIIYVGGDIGNGEVEAVDRGADAGLPVPVVVVGDAIGDVVLDI